MAGELSHDLGAHAVQGERREMGVPELVEAPAVEPKACADHVIEFFSELLCGEAFRRVLDEARAEVRAVFQFLHCLDVAARLSPPALALFAS